MKEKAMKEGSVLVRKYQTLLNFIQILLDGVCCLLSFLGAYGLWFSLFYKGGHLPLAAYLKLFAIALPGYLLLYYMLNLYESYRGKSLLLETGRVIQANLIGVVLIFMGLFIVHEADFSRPVIVLFFVMNVLLTGTERVILRKTLRKLRSKGLNLKNILVIGWSEAAEEYYNRVLQNLEFGYRALGYIAPESVGEGCPLPYLGGYDKLDEELSQADEAVIAFDYEGFRDFSAVLNICEKTGVKASVLPFYTKYLPACPEVEELAGIPVINVRKVPLDDGFNHFIKRAFDIAASAVLLVLLSPFLLAVAVGVKVTSPGPVIFKQERLGLNKKIFTMYKFRSMRVAKDGSDKTGWSTKGDPRKTKFGSFIRKFSIDELPQLFNVLKGDMSLVGPRPEVPYHVEHLKEEIPRYMVKHLVAPGITGWAQVNGWRGDTSIEERIKCDLYYIENWSFLLDIKILLMTVFKGFISKSE